MNITLVEKYNPAWPSWFKQISCIIAEKLQAIPHTIEQIGSTAIPGMTAKPIIDLDIVIEPGSFELVKDRLEELGYFYEGDLGVIGREAFDHRRDTELSKLPAHHLYVCRQGAYELQKHLVFRDFMRIHPEWIQRLSALKTSLCRQHNNDRQSYIYGKAQMVQEITELAFQEFDGNAIIRG